MQAIIYAYDFNAFLVKADLKKMLLMITYVSKNMYTME